jgi:formyltetrahydrofolate hydrolase
MSKMAELSMEINDLIDQGMSVKFIATKLGIPFQMVQDEFDNRENLELEKQYEYLSYADECANDDAQYYGGA